MPILSILLAMAFTMIAGLHVYWACGGKLHMQNIIPSRNGAPVFTPGPVATLLVAMVLFGFAGVSLALGFPSKVPDAVLPFLKASGIAIGIILLVRAVGDFKYAGFFKRLKDSPFARYDDWLYSPFCLISGGGFLYLSVNFT